MLGKANLHPLAFYTINFTSPKLADKSDTIRTRADVEHLIEKELAKANGQDSQPVKSSLEDFVEQKYLPWVADNKAAVQNRATFC